MCLYTYEYIHLYSPQNFARYHDDKEINLLVQGTQETGVREGSA